MTVTTNKAWHFDRSGRALYQEDTTLPDLASDEILIKNKASGINPVDWKFIEDDPLNWPKGRIPGVDGAGEVVATGATIDEAMIGQQVTYHQSLQHDGSFAAFTVVKANRVMQLPNNMSFEFAAALPCPMLTAWQAVSKLPPSPGAKVLVAGMGAVNKLTVQFLKRADYEVHALSGSLEESEANALGITSVFRDAEDLPQQYFAVIDAVSADNATKLVSRLQANGHIVCIQGRIEKPVDPAFTRTISYHEVALGALHQYGDEAAWTALMKDGESLLEDIQAGLIVVDDPVLFPFSEMNHALSHSKQTKEKTVLDTDG